MFRMGRLLPTSGAVYGNAPGLACDGATFRNRKELESRKYRAVDLPLDLLAQLARSS